MLHKREVAVLDIGSKVLSAYVAERISADSFTAKEACDIPYSGYYEGKFVDVNELKDCIFRLLDNLERKSHHPIKTLYIGIPAQFCVARSLVVEARFRKARRVLPSDLTDMLQENNPYCNTQYTAIHSVPLMYATDGGVKTLHPVGNVTTRLKGSLSYIAVDTEIIDNLRYILKRRNVKNIHFMQAEYLAAMELFTAEEREDGVLIADVGYLSTSVMYVRGDGVCDMKSFSFGGGMIEFGLASELGLSYDAASALAGKLDVSREVDYTTTIDGDPVTVPAKDVNEIAMQCIVCIANYIKKAIAHLNCDFPAYQTIYLTGGGVLDVRGGVELMERFIGQNIDVISPNVPNFNKPYYSTAVGVIMAAFRKDKEINAGFFKKLFGN